MAVASPQSEPQQIEQGSQDLRPPPTIQEVCTWDDKKLLQWIQQKHPHHLENDDLKAFQNAKINGIAFLGMTQENFTQCSISVPISAGLKFIADGVKESKPLDQKAGMKRKRHETDASGSSISPKTKRQKQSLERLASRANELRQRVKSTITDVHNSVDQPYRTKYPLAGAVDELSNPDFDGKFPFPYAAIEPPERIKTDDKGIWSYVGRTKFRELVHKLNELPKSGRAPALWLYGTQGYGKSHLLAALVCYLAAQDERVVYIPTCRTLLRDPVDYVRTAILFAWADDMATTSEIMTLDTQDDIMYFLKSQENITFVIDQMNALDTNGSKEDEKRQKAHEWIMKFTFTKRTVFSTSANNMSYHEQFDKETQDKVLFAYGGLTRAEMDHWWGRHSDVDMGGLTKETVEDLTGCIPLLLDRCVVGTDEGTDKGTKIDLTVGELRKISAQAVKFTADKRKETVSDPSSWKTYCELAQAFCFEEPLDLSLHARLIDHRYFYIQDGRAHYTCGLVRNAIVAQLAQQQTFFKLHDILSALGRYIDNPSITGFMMELAVLSSISTNGLPIREGIRESMIVKNLRYPPKFDLEVEKQPVLYWPTTFNYEAIDGIIVLIEAVGRKKKKKLVMYPLQITLALGSHKDSHKSFFQGYKTWKENQDLSDFDVEIHFLWISPEKRLAQEYQDCDEWPRHSEEYITFEKVKSEIWEKYKDANPTSGRKKGRSRRKSAEEPAEEPIEEPTEEPATKPATKGSRQSQRIQGRDAKNAKNAKNASGSISGERSQRKGARKLNTSRGSTSRDA